MWIDFHTATFIQFDCFLYWYCNYLEFSKNLEVLQKESWPNKAQKIELNLKKIFNEKEKVKNGS